VAAAHAAGLDVLGDESVLVARTDADALACSVRELTVREDSARLLGLLGSTAPAFTGGEEKRRVDLFANSRPESRTARRVTTLLLGPRALGPARLVPLSPSEFLEEFAKGEIPQEHVADGASSVARAWAEAGGSRLDGASDLAGAVALLKSLVD
jgi:isocitrate lyase